MRGSGIGHPPAVAAARTTIPIAPSATARPASSASAARHGATDDVREAGDDEDRGDEAHEQDVALLAEVEAGVEVLAGDDDDGQLAGGGEGAEGDHAARPGQHGEDDEADADDEEDRGGRRAGDADPEPAGDRRAERGDVAAVEHEALRPGVVDEQRVHEQLPAHGDGDRHRRPRPAPITGTDPGEDEADEEPGDGARHRVAREDRRRQRRRRGDADPAPASRVRRPGDHDGEAGEHQGHGEAVRAERRVEVEGTAVGEEQVRRERSPERDELGGDGHRHGLRGPQGEVPDGRHRDEQGGAVHEHEGDVERRRDDGHQRAVQRSEVGHREAAEVVDGGCWREAQPVLVGR